MTLRDFTETNLCRWKILGVVEQTKQRRWKSASLSNKLLYSKWPFESSCFFVLGGVRTWFSPVPRGPSLGLHSSLPPFSSCRIWRKRNVSFLLFLLLRLLNWNYTPSGRPVELGWPTVFDSIQKFWVKRATSFHAFNHLSLLCGKRAERSAVFFSPFTMETSRNCGFPTITTTQTPDSRDLNSRGFKEIEGKRNTGG